MENNNYINATQEYNKYLERKKKRNQKFKVILATNVPALPQQELKELQDDLS